MYACGRRAALGDARLGVGAGGVETARQKERRERGREDGSRCRGLESGGACCLYQGDEGGLRQVPDRSGVDEGDRLGNRRGGERDRDKVRWEGARSWCCCCWCCWCCCCCCGQGQTATRLTSSKRGLAVDGRVLGRWCSGLDQLGRRPREMGQSRTRLSSGRSTVLVWLEGRVCCCRCRCCRVVGNQRTDGHQEDQVPQGTSLCGGWCMVCTRLGVREDCEMEVQRGARRK